MYVDPHGETVTLAVPLMPLASYKVADMVWLPGVFRTKPLVHVWEPASAEVNWYSRGRTAAGSELVKLM